MPTDYRDEKTVASVSCPYCLRAVGAWCVRRPGDTVEITSVHTERREAWQQVRGPGESHPAPVYCECGHGANAHRDTHPDYDTLPGCRKCDCPKSGAEVKRA
jgi:hypothetical protein